MAVKRGPNRPRLITKGDLETLIMHLVSEGARHGYDIIGEIDQMSGFTYAPSPGAIYPALEKLVKNGMIVGEAGSDRRRKSYVLTAFGLEALEANQMDVDRLKRLFAQAKVLLNADGADPIATAIERLEAALATRPTPLPTAMQSSLAARIDELTRRITAFED